MTARCGSVYAFAHNALSSSSKPSTSSPSLLPKPSFGPHAGTYRGPQISCIISSLLRYKVARRKIAAPQTEVLDKPGFGLSGWKLHREPAAQPGAEPSKSANPFRFPDHPVIRSPAH